MNIDRPAYQNLGELTRRLHEVLSELGHMPSLQAAADQLPDTRSRLGRVAELTGQAAERALNAVDQARLEQDRLLEASGRVRARLAQSVPPLDGDDASASAGLLEVAEASAHRTNECLTEIMMAQDFHDLTTQIIARVATVAQELEERLVRLLIDSAPPERRGQLDEARLAGPTVPGLAGVESVTSQQQVDDLLGSLGF